MKPIDMSCWTHILPLNNLPAWGEFDRVNVMMLLVDDMKSENPRMLVGCHTQGEVKTGCIGFPGGGVENEDRGSTKLETLVNATMRELVQEAGVTAEQLADAPQPLAAMRVERMRGRGADLHLKTQLVIYLMAEVADLKSFKPARLRGTEEPMPMKDFQMQRLSKLLRLPVNCQGGLLKSEAEMLGHIKEIMAERAAVSNDNEIEYNELTR